MSFTTRLEEAKENPSLLSTLHLDITTEYARISDEYESKLPLIALKKKELLQEHKSVTRAEAEYWLTDTGVWEQSLKIRLKGYEKMMAGIRSRLNQLDLEAKNQW